MLLNIKQVYFTKISMRKQQQWTTERDETNDTKRDLQTEVEKNLVKLQEF